MRTFRNAAARGYQRAAAGAVSLLTALSVFPLLPKQTASAATLLAAEFETTNDSFSIMARTAGSLTASSLT